jgi:transcription elongation factor/antiterminator RfaH
MPLAANCMGRYSASHSSEEVSPLSCTLPKSNARAVVPQGSIAVCDSEGEATVNQMISEVSLQNPGQRILTTTANWYAVQTRSRHEKVVAHRLEEQGIPTFLPTIREERRWSDRRKIVEFPLFSCYVFVNFAPNAQERLRVCQTDGVFHIVGVRGEGTPIPEQQIDAVRTLLSQQLPCQVYPFLKIGQRVRIKSGALAGIEGVLTGRSGERMLVISLDAIQRSMAVRIEGYDVEAI